LNANDDTITNKIVAMNIEKKSRMEQETQRKKLAESKEAVRLWKMAAIEKSQERKKE
jgi:hypothetical protein